LIDSVETPILGLPFDCPRGCFCFEKSDIINLFQLSEEFKFKDLHVKLSICDRKISDAATPPRCILYCESFTFSWMKQQLKSISQRHRTYSRAPVHTFHHYSERCFNLHLILFKREQLEYRDSQIPSWVQLSAENWKW
jgi:hypothetical protein